MRSEIERAIAGAEELTRKEKVALLSLYLILSKEYDDYANSAALAGAEEEQEAS